MSRQPDYGFDIISEAYQKDDGLLSWANGVSGPSTYLHAVAGKGWPHDHKAEDAFELPGNTVVDERPQYRAEYMPDGGVNLVLITPLVTYTRTETKTTIASFNNYEDAHTAAKALNELKGY